VRTDTFPQAVELVDASQSLVIAARAHLTMAFVAYTIITKNMNPVRLAAEANVALWVRAAAVLVLVLVIEGSVDRRDFRLPFQCGGLSAARRIGWASNRGRTLAGKKRDDSAAVGGDSD
jgi:hypothetical protein